MASDSSATQLKSDALMEQMKQHLSTDAGKAVTKKIGLVYQINIAPKVPLPLPPSGLLRFWFRISVFDSGAVRVFVWQKIGFDEVVYIVDLKKGEVTKGPYEGGKPDATFSFKDDDFIKVATGKMNPQIAFMRGAMKIKGSLSAAQKFTPDIFPKPSKM
ncbi:hypothetical protein EUGRSUZ_F02346 [Eucalyptus grandis]|uniref:Uncharacterized protein n=2 Tax=Eucalyptus grandis TaxID=71139 RepID=A0ACC3KGN9_EUCGR|nr:hypothetical protein EUGRSUZ_F02346 [Eucalyptus grandis]